MKRSCFLIVGVVLSISGSLLADNCVQIFVERNGWFESGVLRQSFEISFEVEVPAQTVEVKFPGSLSYIPMEYDDEDANFDLGEFESGEFETLTQLFAAIGISNGSCYFRIDKGLSTESIYRFSMNTDWIVADHFPGFATEMYPDEGQTVGPTVTFTWTNPEGYEDFIGPWMDVEQGYDYYDGGMQAPGTTEWTCGPMADGPATFEIGYASLRDGIAGVLTYVSGKTIVWGLSEFSPDGWTPGKPLTGLVSDLDIHFQVSSMSKASASIGYIQRRTGEAGADTYNAVVRVTIPNASAVYMTVPSSPNVFQELEWISPNTYRIRLLYSSFAEMMAAVPSGTYTIHIFDQAYVESVYCFQIDSAPVHLEDFPDYASGVQPPRDSLIEIPATFTWALPEGYLGGVMAIVAKETGSPIYMLPPKTTSVALSDFDFGWNQLVLMTTGTVNGVTGPMTYQSGFEIDWDQTESSPKGWPKTAPYTYLGSEWMGDYYAIEPGQCVFHLPGDLNGDCRISLEDFAMMAQFWLMDCRGNQVGTDCWAFL